MQFVTHNWESWCTLDKVAARRQFQTTSTLRCGPQSIHLQLVNPFLRGIGKLEERTMFRTPESLGGQQQVLRRRYPDTLITPPPVGGTGYCFRAISFFLCFFVSNITRKRLDRFAWNFQRRCGVTMGRLIKFWANSGTWYYCCQLWLSVLSVLASYT